VAKRELFGFGRGGAGARLAEQGRGDSRRRPRLSTMQSRASRLWGPRARVNAALRTGRRQTPPIAFVELLDWVRDQHSYWLQKWRLIISGIVSPSVRTAERAAHARPGPRPSARLAAPGTAAARASLRARPERSAAAQPLPNKRGARHRARARGLARPRGGRERASQPCANPHSFRGLLAAAAAAAARLCRALLPTASAPRLRSARCAARRRAAAGCDAPHAPSLRRRRPPAPAAAAQLQPCSHGATAAAARPGVLVRVGGGGRRAPSAADAECFEVRSGPLTLLSRLRACGLSGRRRRCARLPGGPAGLL
jgi:hypothetical protein